MADVALVAIDPLRLGVLEERLQWLDSCCRRWAVDVEGALAGTGAAAPDQVAALGDLAAWCRRTHDEVRWRRAVVEAIGGLPSTAWRFRTRAEAVHRAERLATRLRVLLAEDPPPWGDVRAALLDLERGRASPTFAATFFTALGGEAAAALPALVERSFLADWRGRAPWSPDGALAPVPPPLAEALAVLDLQQVVAEGLRRASTVEGDLALPDAWLADFTGLRPEDVDGGDEVAEEVVLALRGASYGLRFAHAVAEAAGHGRLAVVVLAGPARVAGIVSGVAATAAWATGEGGAGADTVFGTVGTVTALVGGFAVHPLAAAGAIAVGALFTVVAEMIARSPVRGTAANRRGKHAPGHDPATGRARTPAGHPTNPHVDEAGVPLPPHA